MKLSDKIYYCRKKAGLSQDELAEKLGISRQAVSKWETGDTAPDLGNLRELAACFGVTTDWLLSDEEPENRQEPEKNNDIDSKINAVTGFVGKILRKYGWLAGVHLMIGGGLITAVGIIGLIICAVFASVSNSAFASIGIGASERLGNFPSGFTAPILIFTLIITVIGIAIFIVGIILKNKLKKLRSDGQK